MEYNHIEESFITDFVSKIKDIPKDIWNKITGKEEETIKFFEQYLLVMDNPYDGEKTFTEPYIEENKKIFEKFRNKFKISDEDKKKFIENFKKYIASGRKKINTPAWLALGFLMGLFPVFDLIITLLELVHFGRILYVKVTNHPLYKNKKEENRKQAEQERKEYIENFKTDHPNLWNFYLKVKIYFTTQKTEYSETDEPAAGPTVKADILSAHKYQPYYTTESISIISYDEYKNRLNENTTMAYLLGGIPVLLAYGFGRLLRNYLDNKKRMLNIKILLEDAKKNNKSKSEIKKLENTLVELSDKDIKLGIKIKETKEKLKADKKTLDSLTSDKKEEAKKLAAKYEKELKNLKIKEIKYKNAIDSVKHDDY